MAEFTLNIEPGQESWENFLQEHQESSFLQSWYWGEFNEALGKKIFRISFEKNNKTIGVCLAIVENARRGKYMVVPGGPLIDWENSNLVDTFFVTIKKLARQFHCIFVRIRPQLTQNDQSIKLFRKFGAKDAPVHLHAELTSQLDLSLSEEKLLVNMRKSTRYEIKKAQKEGITIVKSADPQLINNFYKIQLETAKRQKFVPFSSDYLQKQFEVFSKNNLALLFESYYEKKLLSQAFIIFYNREAVYHYGTSTEEGRRHPGPSLSQWEIIKEAKKRGMSIYNFWGVSPLENNHHRFYKISVFKRGFGGIDHAYLHAQDLVIDKNKYFLNLFVENIRKKMRSL